jgi:hypothetical protein
MEGDGDGKLLGTALLDQSGAVVSSDDTTRTQP